MKTKFAVLAALLVVYPTIVSAQKKPLDHSVYDSWQSVSGIDMADDGKILSWQVNRQEGDNTLYIRNLQTGREICIERGSDFEQSQSSDYATFTISVPYAVTRQSKIDKKKSDETPKDTAAYINLKTFEIVKLANVGSLKSGFDAAPFVAGTLSSKDKKAPKQILLVETATGKQDTIKYVTSFEFSKDGLKMAAITSKDEKDSLSKSSVVLYDLAKGSSEVLSEGRKAYTGLKFNNEGDKLLFMATDQEEKVDGTPRYAVYLTKETVVKKATRKTPAVKALSTEEIIPQDCAGLPDGWVISKSSRMRFSNSSGRVIFALNEYLPAKDTTVYDFEAAQLDIWRWNSQTVPPMFKARGAGSMGTTRTLTAMVDLSNPSKVLVLSQNANDRVVFVNGADADFAVASDTDPYVLDNMWAIERKADMSIINLSDGSRRTIAEAFTGTGAPSTYGKYLAWFSTEDGNWYTMDVATGSVVNLTANVGVPFYDASVDTPSGYSPFGYRPTWVGNDEYLLLCDQYDVWKFTPDGKKYENLTKGAGRRSSTDYRVTMLSSDYNPYLYEVVNPVGVKDDIYLTAFNEITKENGYAVVNVAKASEPVGFTMKKTFGSIIKASDASVIAYTKGDFQNPYDLYVTSDRGKDETRLTSINPQQKDYLWGDAQLVHWAAYDGTKLDGLLFTPENCDPSKKYPMMIYFYEKNAETLYNYRAPAPSRSTVNIPFYVSRGYVVFVPDIVYTVGHPGESAYNCICAGAEAMCEQFPFIDRSKMAIQGQSWGGYQTAYLVTRTDMFAAAGAGAPVGNMTSAYGGIRWESGSSRIGQYEHGQSRIGKTLWEDGGFDLYVENSPVFFAPNVKTPVLIMHNDADGAVPWYQGIEFFMSLRRLGKPAWLLEYNDEAHNLVERRNCKDLSIRLQQFFDHYLKDEAAPAWMEKDIPYARKGNYFATELLTD